MTEVAVVVRSTLRGLDRPASRGRTPHLTPERRAAHARIPVASTALRQQTAADPEYNRHDSDRRRPEGLSRWRNGASGWTSRL
jgi:hypothetical protein